MGLANMREGSQAAAPRRMLGIYAEVLSGHETIEAAQNILSGHGFRPVEASKAVILSLAEVKHAVVRTPHERDSARAGQLLALMQPDLGQQPDDARTDGLVLGKLHIMRRVAFEGKGKPNLIAPQLYDPSVKGIGAGGALRLRSLATSAVRRVLETNGNDQPNDITSVEQPFLPLAAGLAPQEQLIEIGREFRSLRDQQPIVLGRAVVDMNFELGVDPEAFPLLP